MRDSLYALVVVVLILKVIQDLRNQMLFNNARKSRHSACNVVPTCSTLQQKWHSYGLLTGLGATLRVQDLISQFANIVGIATAFAVKAHNERLQNRCDRL